MSFLSRFKRSATTTGDPRSPGSPDSQASLDDEGRPRTKSLKDRVAGRFQRGRAVSNEYDENDYSLSRQAALPSQPDLDPEKLLADLSPKFFEEEFDEQAALLEHLPEDLTGWLGPEMTHKENCLDVITYQLSERVMKSYGAMIEGMGQIQELQQDLELSTVLCKNGRRHTHHAQEALTHGALEVLSFKRKMYTLEGLIDTLHRVKDLLEREKVFHEYLEQGEFPLAIATLKECKQTLMEFEKLTCLNGLRNQLRDGYQIIETRMDDMLVQECYNFNGMNFERVLRAYYLLGKTFSVTQKLPNHFQTVLRKLYHEVVLSYVLKKESNQRDAVELKNAKFKVLAKRVADEHMTECIFHLAEVVCSLLYSHYQMVKWLETIEANSSEGEAKCFADIRQSIFAARRSLWDKCQRRTVAVLKAGKVSAFKSPAFLRLFNGTQRFLEFGEAFCGTESNLIRTALKSHSEQHVLHFHKENMESLRMMMEAEMWQRFPMAKDFTIHDIKELRQRRRVVGGRTAQAGGDGSMAGQADSGANPLEVFTEEGNPFADRLEPGFLEVRAEIVGGGGQGGGDKRRNNRANDDASDDDDVADELKVDYIDEDGGDSSKNKSSPANERGRARTKTDEETGGPILTSASLSLVRSIGKYLSMMENIPPAADSLFQAMKEICELYMYIVYSTFSTSPPLPNDAEPARPSKKLITILQRVAANLQRSPVLKTAALLWESADTGNDDGTAAAPRLTNFAGNVDLTGSGDLYGLAMRSVAVESWQVLVEVLQLVRPRLEAIMPTWAHQAVTEFYESTVEPSCDDLRIFIAESVSPFLLNLDNIANQIASCKFDLKEVGSQHSAYVESILQEISMLARRLSALDRTTVPKRMHLAIWAHVAKQVMAHVVEGYSRVKKCNNEGRALMAVDLKAVQQGLESMSNLRPCPHLAFADNFVKAYYLPESDILSWIRDHQEYSARQLIGLVNSGIGQSMRRKQRLDLIHSIEDLERNEKQKVKVG